MVAVPDETPLTTPLPVPTVATEVLLLLQVPPVVASLSVKVEATHTVEEPDIEDGAPLTVTLVVAMQPVPSI
jgi:hypothetical protein